MKQARACNICKNFVGFGLHWVTGKCLKNDAEIGFFSYRLTAELCKDFDTDFHSACEDCVRPCEAKNPYMISCSRKKTNPNGMKKEDKWWADLTVSQKETIAKKIIKKNGIEGNWEYPSCTNVWNALSDERKEGIMKHCTDDHGILIEEWKEGDSYSY